MLEDISTTELMGAMTNFAELWNYSKDIGGFEDKDPKTVFSNFLLSRLEKTPEEEYELTKTQGVIGQAFFIMNFDHGYDDFESFVLSDRVNCIDKCESDFGILKLTHRPSDIAQLLYMSLDENNTTLVNKSMEIIQFLRNEGYDFSQAQLALLRTMQLDNNTIDKGKCASAARFIAPFAVNQTFEDLQSLESDYLHNNCTNVVLGQKIKSIKDNINLSEYDLYLQVKKNIKQLEKELRYINSIEDDVMTDDGKGE